MIEKPRMTPDEWFKYISLYVIPSMPGLSPQQVSDAVSAVESAITLTRDLAAAREELAAISRDNDMLRGAPCRLCGAESRDDPRGKFCSGGFHGPRTWELQDRLAAANATVEKCKAAGWREAKHTDTFTHGNMLIAAVKMHPLGERPYWEIDLVRVDTSDDRFKFRLMNGNEWRWYWDDVRYWMPVTIPTAAEAAREGKENT